MRIVSVVVVVAACGGTPAPKYPTPVDAENQVRALEGEWVQAEMKRDAAALGMIVDDHFVFTLGGDAPIDKAAYIKAITGLPEGWTQTLSEQQVHVDGDLAVTTSLDTVTFPGRPGEVVRYTATYVYRDGHWRPFAIHIAPVTPPAAAAATAPTAPAAPATSPAIE